MSENAQLVSLSRQIALQRQMDVVANNIANINTSGFKSENMLFEQYLMPVARDRDFAFADQPLRFTEDWATVHDMTTGSFATTGNALDVAISGEGFLTVQTPQGERYTRAGSLQLDPAGTLVTTDGYPVLGDGGPIQIGAEETDILISADGAISTSAGAKGQLRLVEFEDPQALKREGSNLFSGGQPQPATESRIVQGMVERSNVSGITEMSEMIRIQRSYESLASLMQRQDETRRDAIRRLGSTSA
jgi:flagellar basal-body rod protein FlgF